MNKSQNLKINRTTKTSDTEIDFRSLDSCALEIENKQTRNLSEINVPRIKTEK